MTRLITRKTTLILILIPLLHALGFHYAQIHPYFYLPRFAEEGAELRYFDYLQQLAQGDLGMVGSAQLDQLISDRLENSLILIGFAILITAVGGLLIGMASVSPHTGKIRPWLFTLTTAGSALPGFLLGGVVIAFAVYQVLYGTIKEFPLPLSGVGIDRHLILPMLVLAVRPMLHVGRVIGGLLQEQLQTDYVRTARSKGARQRRVAWRHALPNMWSQIIALLSQSLRFIVGGLLIAETMFSWPGIGQLFVFSIVVNENFSGSFTFFANPYLIATLFVLVGLLLLTADLLASLASYILTPQVRHD